MAKVHQLKRVQKTSAKKADTAQNARIPVLPGLINQLKIRGMQHRTYTYDESWEAAYRIFALLRSMSNGVKRLEVRIVNSTFKIASTDVDAVVMDYKTWLGMKVQAEKARGVNSYTFAFDLLDHCSIGPVIKGEHADVANAAENLVELRRTDDNAKARRNSNAKTVLVEEYFFVYVRDTGLYGMARVRHQEYMPKGEALDAGDEAA